MERIKDLKRRPDVVAKAKTLRAEAEGHPVEDWWVVFAEALLRLEALEADRGRIGIVERGLGAIKDAMAPKEGDQAGQ